MAFEKRRANSKQEIPTASMPDIVFMLLLFFMVTTTLREVDVLVKFKLPEAKAIEKIENKRLISYIWVGNNGKIQINDSLVKLDDVEHFIGIRELTATSILVEISSNHAVQVTLNIGEDTRVDVTDDGFYDIYVKLRSIIDGKAELTIRYIQEKVPEPVVGEEPEDVVVEPEPTTEPGPLEKTNLVWLWVALAVIALIVVFWIYKRNMA